MQPTTSKQPRKKFLVWLAAGLGSLTFLNMFLHRKKEKQEMITMLTEDGQLVSIDKNLLPSTEKKVTNTELQQWIKRK